MMSIIHHLSIQKLLPTPIPISSPCFRLAYGNQHQSCPLSHKSFLFHTDTIRRLPVSTSLPEFAQRLKKPDNHEEAEFISAPSRIHLSLYEAPPQLCERRRGKWAGSRRWSMDLALFVDVEILVAHLTLFFATASIGSQTAPVAPASLVGWKN